MPEDKFNIDKIADLAKLKLSPEQKRKFSGQIEEILSYMQQLKELDTRNVEPLCHIHEGLSVFRDDVVKPSLDREKALMNAPAQGQGFFKTPKIKN